MPTSVDGGLRPLAGPELFFGLVGAIGSDLKLVRDVLDEELRRVGYSSYRIRISELMSTLSVFRNLSKRTRGAEGKRLNALMDAGNALRKKTGRGDILAMLAIDAIRSRRQALNKELPREQRPLPRETISTPVLNAAFVLHSLKTPEEVRTLRDTYGRAFYLISAYSPRETRAKTLADRLCSSAHGTEPDGHASEAWALIARDEKENSAGGQNVRDSFPLADLFVQVNSRDRLVADIRRFVEAVFGHLFHTPTRDEFAMFHAFSASLRSADMGRQVGAVITNPTGEIVAVGCNEVPRNGGGLYWEGDNPEGRDYAEGSDTSDRVRRATVAELIDRLRASGWLRASKMRGRTIDEIVNRLLYGEERDVLRGSRVMSAIEYGRSVHAEMAAVSDAAYRGVGLRGATMYCTTFPCHICARHIIAAGVRRVVYVEPYPKSMAEEFYRDSMVVDPSVGGDNRVLFEPFAGIAPSMYEFMFRHFAPRKNATGDAVPWHPHNAKPKLRRFTPSYIYIEEDVIGKYLSPALERARIKFN